MNKAFEKILERLNEMIHPKQLYFCKYAKGECKHLDNDDKNCAECTVELAKEIVQEVAEEFATDTNVGNNGWIPCSERLPKERDWYLAVFEEVDTGFIGIPYIADYLMGSHTKFTTEDGWIIRNCSDRDDESAEYYKNLRCVAWQPLPQPYKESD